MALRVTRTALVIGGAGILLALLIALDVTPYLRGGYGWRWIYEAVPFQRSLPLIAALFVYLTGTWVLLGRSRRALPVLLWAWGGTAALGYLVVTLRHDDVVFEMLTRTLSGMTSGAHMAAARLDWSAAPWRNWPAVMQDAVAYSSHISVSPPGGVLFYRLLNLLLEAAPGLAEPLYRWFMPYQCHAYPFLAYTPAEWASAAFGVLMPVWSGLTVFPLYLVARRLVGERAARPAAAWWALIPSVGMFAPTWNILYPALGITAFWLLLKGLDRAPRRAVWNTAAGLLAGLLTFTNFAFIPLLGLFGVYTLLHCWQARRAEPTPWWRRAIQVGLWFGLGLLIPWLIYWLDSGLTFVDLFQASMNVHWELERPYLPWVYLHVQDWVIFTGLPLVLLWLYGVLGWFRQRQDAPPVVGIALAVFIAALALSGVTRGESGRIWLLFAPYVLVAAAGAWDRLAAEGRGGLPSWAVIGIGQVVLYAALAMHWDVIQSGLTPPPTPPGGLMTERPADARFDEVFRLASWDADVQDDTIVLKLDWQGAAPISRPYWFSALLVTPDGNPAGRAVDWQPLEGRYPTTCWDVGEWVGDIVILSLPPDAPGGDWWISLASFADVERPEERLTVTLPDGQTDTQIGLGPVHVP